MKKDDCDSCGIKTAEEMEFFCNFCKRAPRLKDNYRPDNKKPQLNNKELAKKIVDELFQGQETPIRRLVLEPMDKRLDEAGWCHAAICDIIVKYLEGKR